ncbi:hypothetical protein [Deinococcus marmoris]|uniref:hypothetical protein n=1 Tax=Deinococcus marmoris TaxID=249408 RepID=UPI00158ED409|nr:hypothetical protein [Deinococcus marmoris]
MSAMPTGCTPSASTSSAYAHSSTTTRLGTPVTQVCPRACVMVCPLHVCAVWAEADRLRPPSSASASPGWKPLI